MAILEIYTRLNQMRLQVKTNDSQGKKIQLDLDKDASWSTLQSLLTEKLGISPSTISVGFPIPQIISPAHSQVKLNELGIREGDTLVLGLPSQPTVTSSPQRLVIREMADDNSCLFSAMAYVLGHDRPRPNTCSIPVALEMAAINLRQLAATLVLSDPTTYTAAVLGMSPDQYSRWIIEPQHWGGGIELAVFSKFFTLEVASIDVATGRVDVFGEGAGYEQRAYLLYSGIHYDALALALVNDRRDRYDNEDVTLFSPHDDSILGQALEIAELARVEHRYTDMAKFSLQCDQCGLGLVGEREARAHAQQTSHSKFTEFKGFDPQ